MKKPIRRLPVIAAIFLWLLSVEVFINGCAAKQTIHPNSINAFDSQSADDLLLVQTILCGPSSTTTSCPGGLTAEAKEYTYLLPFVQTATKSYNTAQALYAAWVSTVQASGPTAPVTPPTNVQQAIIQAKADTANAQRQAQTGAPK